MKMTNKMATKAGNKCAICKGQMEKIQLSGQFYYFGIVHKDYLTGERWAICSDACFEMFQTNPLAYKASYKVGKIQKWLNKNA